MDREQAIEKLRSQRNVICNDCLHAVGWCKSHCGLSEAIDMAMDALKAQLSQEGTTKDATSDLIDRQVVIDVLHGYFDRMLDTDTVCPADIYGLVKCIPPAQPEPSIPLSWIDKYIEWLQSFDNEFANLEAAHISVMVNKWRDEQDE